MALTVTEAKKPTSADAAGEDNSSAMAPVVPGGASEPEPLPACVHFSPTREECLALLDRWIGGDDDMPDTHGLISQTNFYGASPDALRRLHPPAIARDGQRAWWFLSETKPQVTRAGGDSTKRADRRVDTGGYWRPEQRGKEEPGAAGSCFAFYSGPSRKGRTPWRMEEFTCDKGQKKKGGYALYRLYVSPRAGEEELRAVYGEDGVPVGPGGNERPARATVLPECFDAIAALLPPGSVRGGVGPRASQQPDELGFEEGCLITFTG